MYVGRIVAVGRTRSGRNAALYRVSSRSFPNRMAVDNGGVIAVAPRPGHEEDARRNPYVSYNALRIAGDWAVASNGSHADPIAEKAEDGVPIRDSMAQVLLAFDYERDALSTPRVAAAVPRSGDSGWLAVVRRDALIVREVPLRAGEARYAATYEANDVGDDRLSAFDAADAADAARFAVEGGAFASLTHPVTSAAALADGDGFALGVHVVE